VISVTFSSKFGSFDILKRRTRCGFKPASAQIRPTLEGLIPITAAIELRLQCVVFGGNPLAVLDRTLRFTAGDTAACYRAAASCPATNPQHLLRCSAPANATNIVPT
jgi:hypothetical protein